MDSHKLPAIFPIEALGLIGSLLELVDKYKNDKVSQSTEQFKLNSQSPSYLDEALRAHISRTTAENNRLHNTLVSMHEEIDALKNINAKLII